MPRPSGVTSRIVQSGIRSGAPRGSCPGSADAAFISPPQKCLIFPPRLVKTLNAASSPPSLVSACGLTEGRDVLDTPLFAGYDDITQNARLVRSAALLRQFRRRGAIEYAAFGAFEQIERVGFDCERPALARQFGYSFHPRKSFFQMRAAAGPRL